MRILFWYHYINTKSWWNTWRKSIAISHKITKPEMLCYIKVALICWQDKWIKIILLLSSWFNFNTFPHTIYPDIEHLVHEEIQSLNRNVNDFYKKLLTWLNKIYQLWNVWILFLDFIRGCWQVGQWSDWRPCDAGGAACFYS